MRTMLKLLLICFALSTPLMVQADSGPGRHIQLAQGNGKSLNEAVEQVRRQYKNGRIISAETRTDGKREVHRIRVMDDGKIRTIKINGRKVKGRKRG